MILSLLATGRKKTPNIPLLLSYTQFLVLLRPFSRARQHKKGLLNQSFAPFRTSRKVNLIREGASCCLGSPFSSMLVSLAMILYPHPRKRWRDAFHRVPVPSRPFSSFPSVRGRKEGARFDNKGLQAPCWKEPPTGLEGPKTGERTPHFSTDANQTQ